MGYRPTGGVLMREMSRMPTMDDSNVRGMGVALRVSTSTSVFIFLIFSLSSTPKSCSSSTIIKPMSLKSPAMFRTCLLYTSDADDDLLCVDLGGRRIIKKKK